MPVKLQEFKKKKKKEKQAKTLKHEEGEIPTMKRNVKKEGRLNF